MATYHAVGSAIRNGLSAATSQIPAECGGRLRLFYDELTVGSANVPNDTVISTQPLALGHMLIPAGSRIAGGFLAHDDMSSQTPTSKIRIAFSAPGDVPEAPIAPVDADGELELYNHRTSIILHAEAAGAAHALLPWVKVDGTPHTDLLTEGLICWMVPVTTGRFDLTGAKMAISLMFVVD